MRWHLLSLDAPSVAVSWTWLFTRSHQPAHRVALLASMFLAVWMLYAGDRLLDARQATSRLEARHRFHGRYGRRFALAIGLAGLVLLPLLTLLPRRELLLFAMLASLLTVWFGVIHGWARRRHEALPKSTMVAVFFAAATAIPAWSAPNHIAASLLLLEAALFGGVCLLNCWAIETWERLPASLRTQRSARLQRLALLLLTASILTAFASAALRAPALCVALSVVLLLALDRSRRHLHASTLRAAADAALLTPLLLPCLSVVRLVLSKP